MSPQQRIQLTPASERRHPSTRYRRWAHLADLRHPTSHREVNRTSSYSASLALRQPHNVRIEGEANLRDLAGRILPEIRRRAHQEPAEAGVGAVR